MKERPILFSGAMVRAILEGRKTQTRRIVKPQPTDDFSAPWPNPQACLTWHDVHAAPTYYAGCGWCKQGGVGDRLWVKETWMPFGTSPGRVAIGYKASNDIRPDGVTFEEFGSGKWFDASEETYYKFRRDIERMEVEGDKWRPSIYMPRWASRIALEITNVRVQRLNDISQEDAMAEGVTGVNTGDFVTAYASLWESINGKDSWAANPWVWAITFKRINQ